MNYSDASIEKLIERIGWYPAIQPTEITVSDENLETVSGRYFNSFHQSSTVENVFACIPNVEVDNDVLNIELAKLKKDAVLDVLYKVFNSNIRAYQSNYQNEGQYFVSPNYKEDYSETIIENSNLFDEAIGYGGALKSMQLFLTSKRSNGNELQIDMTYEMLKGEAEGFFNDFGRIVAKGVFHKYEDAVLKIIDILFPVTSSSKKVLIGRNPW